MGAKSRRKGASGELELAKAIAERFGVVAERTAQRSGRTGTADIVGLDGYHIESKRVARIAIQEWVDQAVRDHKPGSVPVVITRGDRCPDWLVVVRLSDWVPARMVDGSIAAIMPRTVANDG